MFGRTNKLRRTGGLNTQLGSRHLVIVSSAVACVAFAASGGLVTGASAAGSGLSTAAAVVKKYEAVPTQPAPVGPKFDAKKAKGKLIYFIPVVAENFNTVIYNAMENVAKHVGAKVVLFPTNGQLSQYQAGVEAAISAHANVIDLYAVDPSVIAPELAQARKDGIKITLDFYEKQGTKIPAGFYGGTEYPGSLIGTQLADFAINATGGKIDALIEGAIGNPQATVIENQLVATYKKNCSGCSYTVLNESIPDLSNFNSATASALEQNPGINYVIDLFDAYAPITVAGVAVAGDTSKVHIEAGYNGTPADISLIGTGPVTEDIGTSADYLGYATMNNDLRVAIGLPAVTSRMVDRIWDSSNVSQAGRPPSFSDGYGSGIFTPFAKEWELKK